LPLASEVADRALYLPLIEASFACNREDGGVGDPSLLA
jgi:hypothetical protein